jgi:hypothetical protein
LFMFSLSAKIYDQDSELYPPPERKGAIHKTQ